MAIGPALAAAGEPPLGATILAAVEATAALDRDPTPTSASSCCWRRWRGRRSGAAARCGSGVREVLAETTVADAAEVYAAIRRARPGGLGAAAGGGRGRPRRRVTLRDAMALAAERDSVAREYATDFAITFEIGVPALRAARSAGLDWSDAVVETYLRLLAAVPDTHIARKLGPAAAEAVSRRAREVRAGGRRRAAEDGRRALAAFDAELREPDQQPQSRARRRT